MLFYFFRSALTNILCLDRATSPLYDASISGQLNFQRPATQTMEHLVDLHHDIFSILLFLCTVVFYLLAVLIYKFNASDLKTKRNFFFKSHSILEICWTVVPMFVVAFMLYPSFALLYAMDELKDPVLSVKIIGHQWY
jgi:cytochrome c oxidase subunit 2